MYEKENKMTLQGENKNSAGNSNLETSACVLSNAQMNIENDDQCVTSENLTNSIATERVKLFGKNDNHDDRGKEIQSVSNHADLSSKNEYSKESISLSMMTVQNKREKFENSTCNSGHVKKSCLKSEYGTEVIGSDNSLTMSTAGLEVGHNINMPPGHNDISNTVSGGFSYASGKKVAVSDDSLLKAVKLLEDVQEQRCEKQKMIPKPVVGQPLVKGKRLQLSYSVTERMSKIFKGIKTEVPLLGQSPRFDCKVSCDPSGPLLLDKKDDEKHVDEVSADDACTTFGSFSSASGKKISMSEAARQKAKKLVAEISKDLVAAGLQSEGLIPVATPLEPSFSEDLKLVNKDKVTQGGALRVLPKGFRPFKPPKLNKELLKRKPVEPTKSEVIKGNDKSKSALCAEKNDRIDIDDIADVLNNSMEGMSATQWRKVAASTDLFMNNPQGLEEGPFDVTAFTQITKPQQNIETVVNELNVKPDKSGCRTGQKSTEARQSTGLTCATEIDSSAPGNLAVQAENSSYSMPVSNTDREQVGSYIGSPRKLDVAQRIEGFGKACMNSEKVCSNSKATIHNKGEKSTDSLKKPLSTLSVNPMLFDENSADSIGSETVLGFCTASGKDISLSQQSLNNAQEKFDAVWKERGSISKSRFEGFTTATGNMISVSSEALDQARQVLETAIEYLPGTSAQERMNEGLCEPEDISDTALEHARQLWISHDKQYIEADSDQSVPSLTTEMKEKPNSKKSEVSIIECSQNQNFAGQTRTLIHSPESKPINNEETPHKVPLSNVSSAKKGDGDKKSWQVSISDTHEKEIFSENESKASVTCRSLLDAENNQSGSEEFKGENSVNKDQQVSGFKGFSTASGNIVSVSVSALQKAKSLLDDVEKSDEKAYYSSHSRKKCVKHSKLHSHSVGTFKGFSTASGNKVSVSEESLVAAKTLMEDIDTYSTSITADRASRVSDNDYKQSFVQGRNPLHKPDRSNEASEPSYSFEDKGCTIVEKAMTSTVSSGFSGFSTASGQKVTVSEKHLAKARKLFDETIHVADASPRKCSDLTCQTTPSGNKPTVTDEKLLQAKKLSRGVETPLNHIVNSDFKKGSKVSCVITANDIKVTEPIKPLLDTNKLVDETNTTAEVPVTKDFAKNTSEFAGYSSASSNKVTVPDENVLKANKLLNGTRNLTSVSKNTEQKMGFTGFSTASGHKVTVSEENLLEAKKIFDEADCAVDAINNQKSVLPGNSSGFSGFATASGCKVSVSEESLFKAKKLLDESEKCVALEKSLEFQYQKKISSGFAGFATASGTKVSVSEESLVKAKELFNASDNFVGMKGATEYQDPRKTCGFSGFTTASGNKVDVSEKNLQEAKKLFDETENTNKTYKAGNTSGFTGFATASGNKVNVSEKNLLEGRKLFDEIENSDKTYKVETGFTGFETASGNKVNVSEKNLQDARKLFDEIESSGELYKAGNTSGFTGVATASGNKVSVSEENLLKAKVMVYETVNSTSVSKNTECETEFAGFSTASGHKVTVSEKNLLEAKKIFDDNDNFMNSNKNNGACRTEQTSGFAGFETASGNKVAVSEENLLIARKLVDESVETADVLKCKKSMLYGKGTEFTGDGDASNKVNKIRNEIQEKDINNTLQKKKLNIFATAGGRNVRVSDKALEEAKKVLDGKSDVTMTKETYNQKEDLRNEKEKFASEHNSQTSSNSGLIEGYQSRNRSSKLKDDTRFKPLKTVPDGKWFFFQIFY